MSIIYEKKVLNLQGEYKKLIRQVASLEKTVKKLEKKVKVLESNQSK